ncbi:hypothetical protein TTHERM_00059090 (macronuclear) [Tetrahymena thermophila SB210]|uniref:Uncharacterized protein n=1 Tax=Tetrahymena thermophila (strain SB210) TaxID=312017 RepID=I7MHC0_TETTS|nr:hypothetical protein TTHERM_00059090 [Tetrahymena thermophila SB210]EAR87396.1 hypothetical protein TTHERM_00059090 [Tetrahymena thermophila SB210]|eukprot:XP_001007641.1 hypothetical protein TTHERM_00059090 [Tetrahymena thermophila SB210]
MFSRICGRVLKNSSLFKQGTNSEKTTTLNFQLKSWFARKASPKFGQNAKKSDEQDQTKGQNNEKPNRILTRKEQINLLTEISTRDKELTKDEIKSLMQQDQRDRDMSVNIINEASFSEYDKHLDKMIEKRIEEGKSANDIVKEILGLQKTQKTIGFSQEYQDQINQAKEESKNYNIFQSDKGFQKQASSYEQFYDILQENQDKVEKLSLTELPFKEQFKLNRKLTESEKFEIHSKAAAVGNYVSNPFADRKNIPKEMLEFRVFEQGNPDRLTYTQKRDLLAEVQESAIDRYEEQKLEKIKKKTILAQKLHAAEIDQKEDKRFRDLVEVDSKNTELQVEAPTDKEKRQLKRDFADPRRNSFLVQEKKLENSLQKLGINKYDPEDAEDYEVMADISKEDLFIQKKLSEENAEFKKKVERRKRIQEVRKFEQKLNEVQFKDVDYTDPSQNFKGQNVPQHSIYTDIPDLQKLKELAQKYNEMQVQDSRWDIHKKRSMKQLSQYIRGQLTGNKGNLESVTLFKPIQVDKISCNEAMTVIYVFWQLLQEENSFDQAVRQLSLEQQALYKYKSMVNRIHTEKQLEYKQKMEEKINVRLNKFAKYFSGMICRDLGFKYGPEVRFAISTKEEKQAELKKEISDVIPEIMKKKLFEKFEKGEIDSKVHKGKLALDIDQAVIDLESKLEERMQSDQTLIAQVKARQKLQKDEQQKKLTKEQRKQIRNKNNKDEFGKKKKKKRENKQKKFWDSLDAY